MGDFRGKSIIISTKDNCLNFTCEKGKKELNKMKVKKKIKLNETEVLVNFIGQSKPLL